MKNRLPEYVQWLMDTQNFPHPVDSVTLIQTHISYVIIAGSYVYKFKKPADFGFLDFTSLAKRKFYCEEELRLNRRLCPKIYLQTVALCLRDGKFCWEGGGEPKEYAVKMKRLAEDRMMGRVMARGELTENDVVQIVDTLLPFYQQADRSRRVKQFGTVQAVTRTVQDNFAETSAFVGSRVLPTNRFNAIKRFAEVFLAKEQLFADRARQGTICECHGDLHSGNVCLEDEVAIFDCIEFNERLRCTDIAADLAFMAMDLDYNGLRDYRNLFINRYIEASEDVGLLGMLGFYMCYRAYVRGKIGLLTSVDEQVSIDVRQAAEISAKKYFELAHGYGEHVEI